MLLRQALEQTRAGMPAPVLFNSRIVVAEHIDEVSATAQKGAFDVRFHTVPSRARSGSILHGFAGQAGPGQYPNRAPG